MNTITNDEHATETNRLTGISPEPEPTLEETAYREMVVDPPNPPWRLKLDPSVSFDGKSYSELIFDYDSLIGKDFQRAERTFTKMYKAERGEVVLPEMKHLYQSILAAQVANVPIGLIMSLPRRYYVATRQEALKACGSSPDEEKA
jgi:hypothetical protein